MKRIIPISAVLFVLAGAAWAGPALDNVVNCFKLDQRTTDVDRSKSSTISPGNAVGQTFVTGPETIALSRIAVCLASYSEEWTDGESLVLTLWDSPEKKTKLASFAMPYKWKMWEHGVIMFPLNNTPVKPNTSYYFELTVDGGNGTIPGVFPASAGYAGGQRYEAGKAAEGDLWFETHVKKSWNRDADYAYYFDHWNLNYPGLEKVKAAVEKKDWDTACKELVAYYETRTDLIQPTKPEKKADYDRSYADLVASMKIRDQEDNVWELGPDWNHFIQWPLRGGVGLTRTGIMKDLVGGYRNTADEKFAKAFNDMILCTRRDQPSPLRAGVYPDGAIDIKPSPPKGIAGGSMWSALGVGARMSQIWYFYSGVAASPSFTQDARCAIIFNTVDSADLLSLYKGGGNWETQINSALFGFGQEHPELKRSGEWFGQGVDGLVENCIETVRPDGVLQEASVNYHGLVTNRFLRLCEQADDLKVNIPASFKRRTEKMIEYMMYSTEPMWFCPGSGDTFNYFSGDDYFTRGAKFFNRRDLLWMATRGKEGTQPIATSAAFKHSGYYIMRSSWDSDALYANIHNGRSKGHGHNDSLQFVASAYGSELLIDPGVYVYGTPETIKISKTSSHGTITVDGSDTRQNAQKSTWESNSSYDYFDGTNDGYNGLEGVKMRRRIVFLKPDYWVILDDVTGDGTHKLDSRFVCAAGKAQVKGNTASFTDGKNGIAVATPADEKITVSIDKGDWARNGKLEPVPVIKKSSETTLPFQTVQAVVPYKGTKAPNVKVESTKLADGSIQVKVSFPGTGMVDTVKFTADGKAEVKRKT